MGVLYTGALPSMPLVDCMCPESVIAMYNVLVAPAGHQWCQSTGAADADDYTQVEVAIFNATFPEVVVYLDSRME